METSRRQRLNTLKPAPRPVPWSLKATLLFGGYVGIFSWGIMALTLAFLMHMDWGNLLSRQIPMEFSQKKLVQGRIQKIEPIEDEKLVRCWMQYRVDGKVLTSYSFTAKHDAMVTSAGHGHLTVVWIEYSARDPSMARVQGQVMSMTQWTELVVFGLGFILSLLLVFGSAVAGVSDIRLLRSGTLTFGRYTRITPLNPELKESLPQYIFAFYVDETRYEVSAETDNPERILDEEEEPLFFMPNAPDDAIVFDNLAGHPDVKDGRLVVDVLVMFKALFFPFVVMLECLIWWMLF